MYRKFLPGLVLALLAACGGGDGTESVILVAASIDPAPGASGITVPSGDRVTVSVTVLTSSAEPATRNQVLWRVASGDAELSDTLSVVDGLGIASVQVQVGEPGEVVVLGTVEADDELTASITIAVGSPPTITSLEPTVIEAGDTVTLTGSGLANTQLVNFGNFRVVPLSTTDGEVVVLAPPCGDTGSISVSARVGFAVTSPVNATWASTGQAISLEVGQSINFDFAGQSLCAELESLGDDGAEYVLTVQSTTSQAGQTGQVVVSGETSGGGGVTTVDEPARTPDFPSQFHDALRAFEQEVARRPRDPMPNALKSPVIQAAAVEVGDTREFRVCNRINCQSASDDFSRVTAEAVYVGDNIVLYQDEGAPSGGFTPAEHNEMGQLLDEDGYEVVTSAFGAETDVDENAKTIVLLTPVVNGITPTAQCSQSIVTGFFFGIDIDPTFAGDPRSNRGEVFYTLVPDPNGQRGCEVSKTSVERLAPVTFVHEFQHMISYGQHVLIRGGGDEALWLNEALSHASEDLVAQRFSEAGDSDRFSQFASGNVVNSYRFLQNSPTFFLMPGQGTGTLEERGAMWLFVRWLADRYGESIYRNMVETSLTGPENVMAATGEGFADLLSDWFLSIFVTDYPNFAAPERFRYTSWAFRNVFASLNEQNSVLFPREYPVIARTLNSTDFSESTNLRSGTGRYFVLQPDPGEPSFRLGITASGGGAPPSSIRARASFIRVR